MAAAHRRILFIKLKEIGDALILTPTLRAAKQLYPEAEIWVLVRRDCAGILAGCVEIDHLLTLSGVEKSARTWRDTWKDIKVLARLRRVYFDEVFELSDGHRARLFAILTRAAHRYTIKLEGRLKWWEKRRLTAQSTFDALASHRVEKDFYSVSEFLRLPLPIPTMSFVRERMQPWPEGGKLAHYCIVQIGSRKAANRWPREKWKEVITHLLGSFEHVVVSCGPASVEVADAEWLRQELGPRLVCTRGKANWAQMACLLSGARLYVGLNTAAMHLATACGCPIVALFGHTSEEHWYPWSGPYRIVTTESLVHLTDPVQRQQRTRARCLVDIQPGQVIDACQEMMSAPFRRSTVSEVSAKVSL